jgi:hypothetical protein
MISGKEEELKEVLKQHVYFNETFETLTTTHWSLPKTIDYVFEIMLVIVKNENLFELTWDLFNMFSGVIKELDKASVPFTKNILTWSIDMFIFCCDLGFNSDPRLFCVTYYAPGCIEIKFGGLNPYWFTLDKKNSYINNLKLYVVKYLTTTN